MFARSPLIYAQGDTFAEAAGDPLPNGAVIHVVIGKWDRLYAEALRNACLRAFPGVHTEVCRRGEDVLRTLRTQRADFALFGLTFVDIDGVDVLQTINRENLARRVMLVSGRKDEHSLQTLRHAQFDAFFDPFEESMDTLVKALRYVAGGRGYLSPSVRRELAAQRRLGVLAPRLTPAELHVFCVIGDGSDDTEAAAQLGLSVSTVRTHRRNIMNKLNVGSSAKLVREAVRLGVVRIKPDGEIIRPGLQQLHAARQSRKQARGNGSGAAG